MLLLVLISFSSTLVYSNTSEIFYTVHGKKVAFIEDQEKRLLISKNCQKAAHFYSCDAFNALKKASARNMNYALGGGKNPGAIECLSFRGAKTLVGLDSSGNEWSLCAFEDGSLIDSGSLDYYGEKHDLRH